MSQKLYDRIDGYIEQLFVGDDPVLAATIAATHKAGMPDIQVSAVLGKFLYLQARAIGARRILELGTLAGYSTIWLARALPPGGTLVTLEYAAQHAGVARQSIAAAGFAERVEVVVGAASETLAQMIARADAPFDLVFIDADKDNYPAYLDLVLQLTRPGSLIIADNVVRGGDVLAPAADDAYSQGARAFNAKLAADPRVEAIVMQLVGAKHHDGFALARVK